jgi:hypothetical protein
VSKVANNGNERGHGPRLTVLGKHVDGLRASVYGDPRLSVFEGLGYEKRALRSSPPTGAVGTSSSSATPP